MAALVPRRLRLLQLGLPSRLVIKPLSVACKVHRSMRIILEGAAGPMTLTGYLDNFWGSTVPTEKVVEQTCCITRFESLIDALERRPSPMPIRRKDHPTDRTP